MKVQADVYTDIRSIEGSLFKDVLIVIVYDKSGFNGKIFEFDLSPEQVESIKKRT